MRIFNHPIKKLTLLTAFAGGYVLGAQAGRERYEQIVRAANQVKADPRVQQAAEKAEDLVRDTATKVTEDPRVKEAAARAQDAVRDVTGTSASGAKASPLLADEHFESEDTVVYSSGPDIEESIDELAPTTPDERF